MEAELTGTNCFHDNIRDWKHLHISVASLPNQTDTSLGPLKWQFIQMYLNVQFRISEMALARYSICIFKELVNSMYLQSDNWQKF